MALCPDGRSLVSCAFDGSVRIWDLQAEPDLRTEATLPTLVGGYGASFTADSRRVITASLTNPVTIWDVVTGEAETIPGLGTNNQSVALSPDQRLLAVGSRDGTLKLWDLANQCLLQARKAHQSPVLKLCFLDAGKSLLSAGVNLGFQSDLRRWETSSGREIPLYPIAVDGCFGMALSPDERHLALTYNNAATKVWDCASGRLEATLGSEGGFTPVFSRNGRLLAAALRGHSRVWEVGSWRQVAVVEVPPADNTYAVAFSPDSKRLVVGSWVRQDSQIALRVWDYIVERELLSLDNRGPWTGWIEFSPDGNTLLAVSWSGVAKLWRAPSWAEIETEEKGVAK